MDDLLPDFLTEAHESLGELEIALVRLEKSPEDHATLSSIFRHVHTIKGTCGFLGLSRLERTAHAAEDVLGKYRDGLLAITPESITLILRAVDTIKEIVASIAATGSEAAGDDSALIRALNAEAAGQRQPAQVAAAAPPPPEVQPTEAEAQPVSVSAPIAVQPKVPPGAAPAAGPAQPSDVPAKSDTSAQTIRVNVDVLENLMALVSELVLTRNQILQLSRSQESSTFTVPLQRLSQITSDLQEGVMKTRMQPVGSAWNGLPRLVRELSRDLGKRIELVLHGADTELDRQLLELIKDPLTHMVRNSADHGLESEADRRAAGKPEVGRIMLNAYHEGGHILIEVSDDGRGLPVDKIAAKIIANGLATEAELAGMPEQRIQSFIFRVGFSTAATVSSTSGRGVGMDVVKTNIERIGGTIDLKSDAGAGTTFTIKIPLTLAIVSALIIEAGRERFAIPQIGVVELVRCGGRGGPQDSAGTGEDSQRRKTEGEKNYIEQIGQTQVLRLRDQLLPLVNLRQVLQLNDLETSAGTADSDPESDPCIVVTQVGASRFGIIVDRVFDTEEIVVKPVAPVLRHITMFSGNTILGDGSVIMILDPNGIARAMGLSTGAKPATDRKADEALSEGSSGKMALLLFRAGSAELKAVPLNLVSRLEDIERSRIESANGAPVTQYRGSLMPLISIGPQGGADAARQPVLVFADGDHTMGLMVDEIVNVVEERLRVELAGDRPGFLGTAVINGCATAIIDTGFWLKQAFRDWFATPGGGQDRGRPSVLIVEDSAFFRSLLIPALSAAGFELVAVPNPVEALRLRDSGRTFDLILSDIEMPEMDGFAFADTVRSSGNWSKVPMIALTSRTANVDVDRGRKAGFNDYVSKFDQPALLGAIAGCLDQAVPALAGRRSAGGRE